MATRDEIFPSKYLKAADLAKPITVTISDAVLEVMKNLEGKEQTKTVVSFKGAKKTLILNMTNWDSIAAVTAEGDSDRWPGHAIELYAAKTTMGGKTVDCIRIRAPAQRELTPQPPRPAPKVAADLDDDIPF